MFEKRHRRSDNEVNAGSMADIAFLLLIFFLVTTTILNENGILVQLPPWSTVPPEQLGDDRVLNVSINAQDELLLEGEVMAPDRLRAAARDFLERTRARKTPVISLQNDRGTSYAAYLEVYNELQAAYRELWEETARDRYGLPYEQLDDIRRKEVRAGLPLVISEAEPTDFPPGDPPN